MHSQVDDLGNVGIIIDDWDIQHPFKKNTLTTDYSSWITYISRRNVPANTPITDIRYWKPIARLNKDLVIDYQNFKKDIMSKLQAFGNILGVFQQRLDDLDVQMQSFLTTAEGGQSLSNMYGNSEVMGITQKALTGAVLGLYQLISDAIGVDMNNVEITITPDSFLKPQCNVNISAIAEFGLLDSVSIYLDDAAQPVLHQEAVKSLSENIVITKTTKIKVEVVLFGRTYIEEKTVIMSSDFFIGSGDNYTDVYKPEYSRPYNGNPQGTYIINVEQGKRIIIIMPTADVSQIMTPDGPQIEMNDFNIPMTVTTFDIYTAFVSVNTYNANTYQIDINY